MTAAPHASLKQPCVQACDGVKTEDHCIQKLRGGGEMQDQGVESPNQELLLQCVSLWDRQSITVHVWICMRMLFLTGMSTVGLGC